MKVLCMMGSPRLHGSTNKVLGWVEEELKAAGHEVTHIDVAKRKIAGCIGCYRCQQNPDELVCALEDDGLEILHLLAETDAAIYATPLYCWDFTAQFKPLIDRHLCLVTGYGDPATYKSHVEGKKMALLVTCAGPAGEGNTDTISEIFRRMADYGKARVAAELIIPGCFDPAQLGDEHREQARSFARQVTA